MQTARRTAGRGFTLTELLVVMAIIGILITFLLIAAGGGVRRAEEKATLALITKLDVGISERMEAILLRRADVAQSHYELAAIYTSSTAIPSPQRAQVIAQIDLLKAELPDVFFVQTANPINGHTYPINFAAVPYQVNGSVGVPLGSLYGPAAIGAAAPSFTTYGPAIGMFGATYQAAAGLHKNLGYQPTGLDGVDNNGDGYVDDLLEGIGTNPNVADPDNPGTSIPLATLINNRLTKHTHKTARSEMLYALLVEGVGPLGSIYGRDEFTTREVGDTDGDGLPEFIDAWGEPLQFYRWPIYYNIEAGTGSSAASTSFQKGMQAYSGIPEPRQVDPLDPNQMLVSIGWWTSAVNSTPPTSPAINSYASAGYSSTAHAFMVHFHSLIDPNFNGAITTGNYWDRGGSTARRAYFSRYLILSGGPDKEPGTAQLGVNYQRLYTDSPKPGSPPSTSRRPATPVGRSSTSRPGPRPLTP